MLKTPTRRSVVENFPLYYPFGITRFHNILKDLNCGIGFENGIKILFLGCGDLRNVLQATTNENAQSFLVHLNDNNPSVLARNILILKILSDTSFNPDKEEDLSFLWDIWYNAELSEVTKKRFLIVLKDILDGRLPENVCVPDTSQLECLKEVWSSWLAICSKEEPELISLMQKIKKDRSTFVCKEFDTWIGGLRELARLNSTDLFSTAVDDIVQQLHLENFVGIEDLPNDVIQKNRDEIRRFFSKGSCRLQSKTNVVCVNPTMLNPATLRWEVHFLISPFHGYLPLAKEELDTSASNNLLVRSCQKILKNFVSSYRSRIGAVKISVHLKDFLEFCYASKNQFDVIDCCNLPDLIGLANVINAATARLSDNPQSALFTQAMKWKDMGDTVEKYVEGSLCVPLNMIPTMYGLRMDNHIELGASALVNLRRQGTYPVNLRWKKPHSFRNVSLAPSPLLDRCLDQIADKCFDIMFPRRMVGPQPGDRSGMLLYTSLTYDYVVSSMIQRIGGDNWYKEDRSCEDWLCGLFDLAKRTATAWKNGQPVLKLTAQTDKPFNPLQGTPVLRLILIPCSVFTESMAFRDNYDLSGPGNHIIDNFEFEIEKNHEGKETITVSFLLVPDHGLGKSHLAFLMDLSNGFPVYIFKALKFMKTEKFLEPHPFAKESVPSAPTTGQPPKMTVKNCIESEDHYLLRIDITCSDSVSGLMVSTNRRKPCESAHDVTISLNQPNNIEPLSMTFPVPILVDGIRATLHRKDHFINLVLKKAVLEPWPHEFQAEHTKWDADRLKLWEEKQVMLENDASGISRPSLASSCMNNLMMHLVCQFKFSQVQTPSLMEKSPLNLVRCIIRDIFQRFTSRKATPTNFVRIYLKGTSAENPDWYLRLHKPIRISPQGSPMLMISAFDTDLAKNLESRENSSKLKGNNFSRVFPVLKPEETMTVEMESAGGLQLLRHVLRLNSLRISPITWQKYNLHLGEDSPWLATFISPLYLDSPPMNSNVNETSENEGNEACCLM